jgi:hypothetical protein
MNRIKHWILKVLAPDYTELREDNLYLKRCIKRLVKPKNIIEGAIEEVYWKTQFDAEDAVLFGDEAVSFNQGGLISQIKQNEL